MVAKVKAVGLYQGRPIEAADSLTDVEINVPEPTGRDVLVSVEAVAVNPIDTKLRSGQAERLTNPKILGYDAVGTVKAVGSAVTSIFVGDHVFYAGAQNRPGSDAALQLVDERLLGRAPSTWPVTDTAGLPLTTLTAWEALFEKAGFRPVPNANQGSVLIVNGAGGVGSIAIQLAKWAGLTVITTAGKPETQAWVKKLGADVVLDYHDDVVAGLRQAGYSTVTATLLFQSTDRYLPLAAEVTEPLGNVIALVTNQKPLPMELLKAKSLNFKWEFMFTKTDFHLSAMATQGMILSKVAQLADRGILQPTTTKVQTGINAETLKAAHATVEAGHMLGKYVLTAPFNGDINSKN